VDPLRRNLSAEQPSGACASEPPDPARGAYADYVERLEDQIAGGVRAGARGPSRRTDDGEGERHDQPAPRPTHAA
jgi:hypothetical protein